jgi:hypothetical protein
MYTQSEFEKIWCEQYHFGGTVTDVSASVPYYYNAYQQLYKLVEGKTVERGYDNDFYILEILWFIEDFACIRLSMSYGTVYRIAKDTVPNYLSLMKLNASERDMAMSIIDKVIASAPESGLMRWVIECVESKDFNQLKNVALYFYKQVACLKELLMYDYAVREGVFVHMFGTDNARKFILSDLSFNWRDKEGKTILHRLGDCLEAKGHNEVADSLRSIQPVKLDCFVVENLNGVWATFRSKSEVYDSVIFNSLPARSGKSQCFLGQLVGWNGKYYVSGPGIWVDKQMFNRWDADRLWKAIEEDVKEAIASEYDEDD